MSQAQRGATTTQTEPHRDSPARGAPHRFAAGGAGGAREKVAQRLFVAAEHRVAADAVDPHLQALLALLDHVLACAAKGEGGGQAMVLPAAAGAEKGEHEGKSMLVPNLASKSLPGSGGTQMQG